MSKNDRRRRLPERSAKAAIQKKETVSLVPELPMFDYSVDRVDRVKYNDAKKKLIDYVATKYGTIVEVLETEEDLNFTEPTAPTAEEIAAGNPEFLRLKFTEDYRSYKRKVDAYEENKPKLFGLLWGQCTTAMRNQLKSFESFEDYYKAKDPVKLWTLIALVSVSGSAINDSSVKMKTDAQFKFNRFRQGKGESIGDFYERFQVEYEAFVSNGGELIEYYLPEGLSDEAKTEFIEQIDERMQKMLAIHFLQKLDRTRFGKMLDEFQNEYDRTHQDPYPVTLSNAYHIAVNRREDGVYADTLLPLKAETGAAFSIHGSKDKQKDDRKGNHDGNGRDGNRKRESGIKCYLCKKPGHVRKDCNLFKKALEMHEQDQQKEAQAMLTADLKIGGEGFSGCTICECLTTSEHESYSLGPNDILADNQSNVNIFKNSRLLKNIRKTKNVIKINGIFGQGIVVDEVGEYDWFGTVYYHPEAFANILCFYDIMSKCKGKVLLDSEENKFVVRVDRSRSFEFVPKGKLYIYSAGCNDRVSFVQTVEDNLKRFTKREIEAAEEAASLHRKVGRPSPAEFIRMISRGHILNCPVTVKDFQRAEEIWGFDVGSLKGKTTRKTPDPIATPATPIPTDRGPITLCMDLLFINNTIFLLSVSRRLNLLVVRHVPDRKAETLKKAIDDTFLVYSQFGLEVKFILCDGEGGLYSLKTYYQSKGVTMDPCVKNEHIPEIVLDYLV